MPTYKGPDGRWRYQFTVAGKKHNGSSPKAHNTERVAARLEKDHIDRITSRRYAGVMPTIKEFSSRFLEYQKAHTKQLTYDLHETIIRVHVEPHLGKKQLDEVRRAELDWLVSQWTCAPRTSNTRLGVVVRMFSLAVEWEILGAVPRVKFLKIPKDHPRFLSDIEAHALLEAATAPWWTMLLTGLRTGLRIGELRGLRWGDIDWRRSLLHVRRTDPGRPDMDPNGPKGNRPRTVPMTPELLAALQRWNAGVRETVKRKLNGPEDWMFPGPHEWRTQRDRDRTRSSSNCVVMISRFAKDAGLTDVTWHTLRHTFASSLVMRGVPLSVVQELLGHASIRMTERYAHLAPGFAQYTAVAALDVPLLNPGEQHALPAPKSTRPPKVGAKPHKLDKRRPLADRPNIERKKRRKLEPTPAPEEGSHDE